MVEDPKRLVMPTPGSRKLLGRPALALPSIAAKLLADRQPIAPLPVRGPRLVPTGRHGVKMDEGYFWGHVPPPVRRNNVVNNERPINTTPLNDTIPHSADPHIPIWVNANYPPWTNPTWWSVPLNLEFDGCIPWYLVPTFLTKFTVPHTYMAVIKGISYEALNADQNDVFTIRVWVGGELAAEFEDINADSTQSNPALRYGINGFTREMPVNIIADYDSEIVIEATLNGPLDLAGNSPYFPGQPITTGDCLVRVILNGWMANVREQVEGGSRPTDLGNLGNLPLLDDQGGYQV